MNECPTFRDVLVNPDRKLGDVSSGPSLMGGVNVARQRAPAHLFERGRTSDLVIVAQQNIASTSVEFDLGYGWREHFCPAPSAVYVIPSNADAHWRLNGESQCVYLSVSEPDAYAVLKQLHVPHPEDHIWQLASKGFEEVLVHELLLRLWQEVSTVGPNPLLGSSCRVAVLHALARSASARTLPTSRTSPKLHRAVLHRVLSAINDMPPDGISIEALAQIAGSSPFHFSRLFRNSVGLSPYAYYDKLRHQRSRELLGSTDLAVSDIALKLGFRDASQFARSFRRHAGCAPSTYRLEVSQ
jgi:AraC family transcriptional regulator